MALAPLTSWSCLSERYVMSQLRKTALSGPVISFVMASAFVGSTSSVMFTFT